MAECCCVMFDGFGLLARDAIDANNLDFFKDYAIKGEQSTLASTRINEKYSIMEYIIVRNQTDLLSYLMNDAKWGLNRLNQDSKDLNNVLKKVTADANKKGSLIAIAKLEENLRILQSNGIDTIQYEVILNAEAKPAARCTIM